MQAHPNRGMEQEALEVGLPICFQPLGHQREIEPRYSCSVTAAFAAWCAGVHIAQLETVALIVVVSNQRVANARPPVSEQLASL